jgi:hypothetical protein
VNLIDGRGWIRFNVVIIFIVIITSHNIIIVIVLVIAVIGVIAALLHLQGQSLASIFDADDDHARQQTSNGQGREAEHRQRCRQVI